MFPRRRFGRAPPRRWLSPPDARGLEVRETPRRASRANRGSSPRRGPPAPGTPRADVRRAPPPVRPAAFRPGPDRWNTSASTASTAEGDGAAPVRTMARENWSERTRRGQAANAGSIIGSTVPRRLASPIRLFGTVRQAGNGRDVDDFSNVLAGQRIHAVRRPGMSGSGFRRGIALLTSAHPFPCLSSSASEAISSTAAARSSRSFGLLRRGGRGLRRRGTGFLGSGRDLPRARRRGGQCRPR